VTLPPASPCSTWVRRLNPSAITTAPGAARRAGMLDAGAVDVLQPDATRCGGVTGFLKAATLAESKRHIEYLHDHVRIEHLLLDGVLTVEVG
jgi:hypothetical protein